VEQLPLLARLLLKLVRFIYAVLRDAIVGNLPMRAMGLVYLTILSIVPIIAISFSVLKGFDFHLQLEPLLNKFLEPLGEKGTELSSQLIGFVDNVQGDVLAGVSLILLFITTVSMAQKVEESFNYIWRVEHSRGIAQRMAEYLSVILVGPVVMATAFTLIASVKSNALVQEASAIQPIGATLLLFGKLAPYMLVSLGFTFVYWFLPNTRVKLTSALVGGLTGGTLWATTGILFATFVASSVRTMTIYAGFAIVIVALIWLYVCWLILLVGAQVAYYYQNPEQMRLGYRPITLGNQQREQIALSLMTDIATTFRNARPHPSIADIAGKLRLPSLLLSPMVRRLEAAALITRSTKDRLLPRRDPGHIKIKDVLAAVREPQSIDVFPEGDWPECVDEVTRRLNASINDALGDASLYDLIDMDSENDKQVRED
jgi:membrane protein